MSPFDQSQRALAAFALAVALAIAASAVCVVFGAGALPSLAFGATDANARSEPAPHQNRDDRAMFEPSSEIASQAARTTQAARVGS